VGAVELRFGGLGNLGRCDWNLERGNPREIRAEEGGCRAV